MLTEMVLSSVDGNNKVMQNLMKEHITLQQDFHNLNENVKRMQMQIDRLTNGVDSSSVNKQATTEDSEGRTTCYAPSVKHRAISTFAQPRLSEFEDRHSEL